MITTTVQQNQFIYSFKTESYISVHKLKKQEQTNTRIYKIQEYKKIQVLSK